MRFNYIILLLVLLFIFLLSCSRSTENQEDMKNMTNEELAQKYCTSCHAFVPPALLPKAIWTKGVLPEMRRQMRVLYQFENDSVKIKSNHTKPLITKETWEKIVAYFAKESPDSLQFATQRPLKVGLKNFKAYPFPYANNAPPLATLLETDPKNEWIYLGENIKNQLSTFDSKGKKIDSLSADSPISDVFVSNEKLYFLTMGKMPPNDDSLGNLMLKTPTKQEILLKKLNRPVFLFGADLDQDNKDEILIAEYGHQKGSLAWFDLDEKLPQKHVLNAYTGNLKSYIADMNQDGLPDIVSLVAQHNEGIFIYFNKGNGNFEEKNVLRFLPVWGSTDFELLDFDNDKDLDIIYTNGDNADCSATLKPYHGVYIFINEGNNNFMEKYFYPLNGAFKVRANDYDQDGDIDLAAISFFPNYSNLVNENFVYLENISTQNFDFEAFTFEETLAGHWFVIDAADIDLDGDMDILLSSLNFAPDNPPAQYASIWQTSRVPFWVLENKTKRKQN